MKKYIYLTIGFILLLGSISSMSNLKPLNGDAFDMGFNVGLLTVPILGLFLLWKFFSISRKERKNIKSKNRVMEKKFYKVYLWSLVFVSILNLIAGFGYYIFWHTNLWHNLVGLVSAPELILLVWSIVLLIKFLRHKIYKIHILMPVLYITMAFLISITAAIFTSSSTGLDSLSTWPDIIIFWVSCLFYLFQIVWVLYVLKNKMSSYNFIPELEVVATREELVDQNKGAVSGWLMFFIFTLFLSILLNFIACVNDIVFIFTEGDFELSAKIWLTALDVLLFGGIMFILAYTAYSLIKLKANAVFLGKMTLIIIFLSNITGSVVAILFDDGLKDSESLITPLMIRSLVYSLLWFLYLLFSKKVKTLYPIASRTALVFDKILVIALLAVVLTVPSLSFWYNTFGPSTDNSLSPATVEWTEFNSAEKKLSILFPSYPEYYQDVWQIGDKKLSLEVEGYSTTVDNVFYDVMIMPYPEKINVSNTETTMQDIVNSILAWSENTNLISSKLGIWDNQPSLDYLIEESSESVFVQGRIIMKDRMAYSLMSVYSKDQNNLENFDKFVQSFKFANN